jgi:hypothetical protein
MQLGGSAGKIAQPDNGQKRFEVTDKKTAGVYPRYAQRACLQRD